MEAKKASAIDFDQCAFGHYAMKPTRLLTNLPSADSLRRKCPGVGLTHKHVTLKGKETDPVTGEQKWKTKAAQVYPAGLCKAFAAIIAATVLSGQGVKATSLPATGSATHPAVLASFTLTTPTGHRKRALGDPIKWEPGRQARSGATAVAAGYQMK